MDINLSYKCKVDENSNTIEIIDDSDEELEKEKENEKNNTTHDNDSTESTKKRQSQESYKEQTQKLLAEVNSEQPEPSKLKIMILENDDERLQLLELLDQPTGGILNELEIISSDEEDDTNLHTSDEKKVISVFDFPMADSD